MQTKEAQKMDFSIKKEDLAKILSQHKLDDNDYQKICSILNGREPNIVELGIFSAMWSEHCSYKSSKIYLNGFPTKTANCDISPLDCDLEKGIKGIESKTDSIKKEFVIQGPGENAGVIDIGGGFGAVFKMESHNHPSFIEPIAGAATGVGGIMRDVFTMGARPVASLNAIRFGEIQDSKNNIKENDNDNKKAAFSEISADLIESKQKLAAKHRFLLRGVVSGISSYGNCMGVPTIGGESAFESSYSGNILVNAFTLGIVKNSEIFYGKASGVGNPVIYVGSKTGRDGLGGAVMSSDSFNENSSSLRPTVQVGDPFTEKLLLEACLELFSQDLIIGIQDMGAAGLTSSAFEMAGRSGSGMKMWLDRVPMRERGMNPYELMLSESQERMLICAKKGAEEKVLEIFKKWELDAAVVGEVSDSGQMELFWFGESCALIPIAPLSESAPILHREVAKGAEYLAKEPKLNIDILAQIESTKMLKDLLSYPAVADKSWIYEQYDSSVLANTLRTGGLGGASAIKVRENGAGVAMSVHCNARLCYLDPREGAVQSVAKSGRDIVLCGATPRAITDCLNFGSPTNPQVMWQFKESCEGIKIACKALGMPVVSGNVSLHNQSDNIDIYPTPSIAAVGVASDFKDVCVANGALSEFWGEKYRANADSIELKNLDSIESENLDSIESKSEISLAGAEIWRLCAKNCVPKWGASLAAKLFGGGILGEYAKINLQEERALWAAVRILQNYNKSQNATFKNIESSGILGAFDIGVGGLGVCAAKICAKLNIGFKGNLDSMLFEKIEPNLALFGEAPSQILIIARKESAEIIEKTAVNFELKAQKIGTLCGSDFSLGKINLSLKELQKIYFESFAKIIEN